MADLKAQIENLRSELADVDSIGNVMREGSGNYPAIDAMKARKVLKGHFGKVYAIHFAGESAPEKLVSASQDGKLIVWNAISQNKSMAIPLRSSWVMTCAFERNKNEMVACGGLDNLCSIYMAKEGEGAGAHKCEYELAHHDGYLSCCRFVGKDHIITSSGDSTCIKWDIEERRALSHYSRHTSDVMSVALSPTNPDIFVSGSCDATCIVWDTRASEGAVSKVQGAVSMFSGHESDINSVAFFPDGNAFGSGSDDSTCKIFDMRSFNQVGEFSKDSILCGITSVDFSISGRLLFAGYDDYTMQQWDTVTEGNFKIQDHDNRVSCIGTESLGRAVCTGSWDTILRVYSSG